MSKYFTLCLLALPSVPGQTYKISRLAELFRVSRPTIYKILEWARKQEFVPRNNGNDRYRCLKYGHKGIDNMTPYEKLTDYFYPKTVNNAPRSNR